MEDFISEIKLDIEELKSSIIVLQVATSNEFVTLEDKDINNYLETIILKINNILKIFKEYENKEPITHQDS